MNAAAKELPVSYDLSKPQEDREPYVGSVLFFKHVIFTVTLLLILIPTTLSIYLFAQVRSLNRQLDTAGSQLAAMQEQLPSTAPEGGEPTPAEPEPPAAEVPAYTELYPELYADDSLRGTVDVDNAVYLTFDDGPSARTDEILEILDKYGVKATFFVVGANEEGDLERMQKIVAAGHTLAIHSYSHDYKKIYASVEAYLEDFNQMFCQIYEATGVKPQIFRFPGGSVNSYNVGIHQQLIAEMTRRGFVYFDWNVANGDAVFSKIQPSSTLTANALKGVGTARRAIILMHDSSAKTTTVEALPAIIEHLREMNEDPDTSVHLLYRTMLETTGYLAMWEQAGEAEAGRVDNLNELASSILNYEQNSGEELPSLSGFLEENALMTDIDNYDAG